MQDKQVTHDTCNTYIYRWCTVWCMSIVFACSTETLIGTHEINFMYAGFMNQISLKSIKKCLAFLFWFWYVQSGKSNKGGKRTKRPKSQDKMPIVRHKTKDN